MSRSHNAGGSAAQGGLDYQNCVAAWVAVHILAEQEVSLPWDLSANTAFEFLRCETEQPVDDLLVGTSDAGHIFVQAKHSLNLETTESSGLASALDQFVRQFVAYREIQEGGHPWERPLDPKRDRLVLIARSASASIRQHLTSALSCLHGLTPGQTIADAAKNNFESKALQAVRDHIARSWRSVMGTKITEGEELQLLRLIHVQILDVDKGGDHEREAKNLLRQSVLQESVLWYFPERKIVVLSGT